MFQTGYPVKVESATSILLFRMVDETDHVTPETGLTPTVTISKNGGSFASPAGTVSEVANGWYKLAASNADTDTLGPLILNATGTGADPAAVLFMVQDWVPGEAVQADVVAWKGETPQDLTTGEIDSGLVQVHVVSSENDALSNIEPIPADVQHWRGDEPLSLDSGLVQSIAEVSGSVSATLSSGERNSLADAILSRSVTNVEATAAADTLAEVILCSFHSSRTATTLTVKRTNDSTTFNERAITVSTTALPVTSVAS